MRWFVLFTFHRKDGIEVYTQLLVPFEIKNEVLKKMHNSVMSGHLGKKKTKGKLSQRYWPWSLWIGKGHPKRHITSFKIICAHVTAVWSGTGNTSTHLVK
jgi:hypothetical protein